MPWRCPACQIQIRHSDGEDAPRPTGRYRCHVCRLELTLDPHTNKLVPAPLVTAGDGQKDRSTR